MSGRSDSSILYKAQGGKEKESEAGERDVLIYEAPETPKKKEESLSIVRWKSLKCSQPKVAVAIRPK
jgi:hypothetical protein